MNIVLVMPFYDQNEEKRKLTKLQFKISIIYKRKIKRIKYKYRFCFSWF